MYLFLDTETTGFPRGPDTSLPDFSNCPHLVQLAWMVTDINGLECCSASHLIKPVGYTIPEDASRIHGITTAVALEKGVDLQGVLDFVHPFFVAAPVLVAHSVVFDIRIMEVEFLRKRMANPFPGKKRICTMRRTAKFVGLPRNKWPKLNELHIKLFKEGFQGAHDALEDTKACARCFFELRRRGVL